MRKLPRNRPMMAVVALAALASLALLASVNPLPTVGLTTLDMAARMTRVTADWALPRVDAQETLKFEPVPAESLEDEAGHPPRHIYLPPADEDRDITIGRSGNVLRFGSDVHVRPDQVIDGDLVVMASDIIVEGHVEGDVVALGGDVTLRSTARVDGDVACMGGVLTEDPGAFVGGQRVTASGIGDVIRDRDGRIERIERSHRRATRAAMHRVWNVASDLAWLLIMVGLAWAFTSLGARRTGEAVERLKSKPAVSLGIGAMVWALVIPSIVALALIVAILCITIIGIPLALAALLGYCLFLALTYLWGYIVASVVVGEWILKRTSSAAPQMSGTTAAVAPSLTRAAIIGVLVLGGAKLIGEAMKGLWFIGWLGGLIAFLAWAAIAVAATFGGGAWLHTEFTTGTLGRWWQGRRGRNGGGAPPSGGGPAPGPAAPPPPSPAPPAPGASPYAPPSATPPPPSGAQVVEPSEPPGAPEGPPPDVPPKTPGT